MRQRRYFVMGYLFILLLFVLTMSYYYVVDSSGGYSAEEFLNDPGMAHGDNKTLMGIYDGLFEGGFQMRYNHRLVRVYSSVRYEPPKYGEVLVYGTFNLNGTMTAIAVHNYDYNYFLYIVSGVMGLLVLGLLLWEWKITFKGFEERRR